MQRMEKLVIVGSGPAGLTAAIYAARANLAPIIIAGAKFGGQLMLTTEVENYPGFVNGILGPDLMEIFKKQAERFGAKLISDDARRVNFLKRPFLVLAGEKAIKTQAVIIATGADANWLGLESEQRLIGRGVSSCAPCDAAFFRNKKVIVVGGGDAAMEEALTLTKFATSVTIVHRRNILRASKIMQQRAQKNPKIEFIFDTIITEVLGKDKVEAVRFKNVKTDKETKFACDGMFVAIGHTPNTKLFADQVELDEKGYIKVSNHTRTSVEGVFAAGDVHDYHYRQAITAAAFGCMAAMDAEKWLESQ